MFEIIVILVCIAINGVLACSEIAFIATDKFVLKGLADSGSKEGSLLLSLRKNPERVLSIIQVGITFVGAFAAAIGGAGAHEFISPWVSNAFSLSRNTAEIISTFMVVIPLTYMSVVFGELVPKSIALRKPLYISTRIVYLLVALSYLLFPIVWILEWSTKKLAGLFFSKGEKSRGSDDIVSEQGREYIINMVKIEKATVSNALIRWDLVESIGIGDTLESVEKKFIVTGHTRLPVVEHEKVVGILNSKEFFAFQKTDNKNWLRLIRKPLELQYNINILKALKLLQKESLHMAIVYKGEDLFGVITIEDILEEIVGDIYDEDDDGSIRKILGKARF